MLKYFSNKEYCNAHQNIAVILFKLNPTLNRENLTLIFKS